MLGEGALFSGRSSTELAVADYVRALVAAGFAAHSVGRAGVVALVGFAAAGSVVVVVAVPLPFSFWPFVGSSWFRDRRGGGGGFVRRPRQLLCICVA